MRQEVFSVLGARVTAYLPSDKDRLSSPLLPAAILCPGGGYQKYGVLEAFPVAQALCRAGCSVFLLSYAIGAEAAHALPLRQISRTVVEVRRNFRHFGIHPNRIFIMGFSAGGHLAATLGTLWNHPFLSEDGGLNCPDALCLCYPLISLLHRPHQGSKRTLLSGGDVAVGPVPRTCSRTFLSDEEEPLSSLLSAEKHVTPLSPPTFLWHGLDDRTVSVEHSLLFAQALREAGVPYFLKLFEHAGHGCGLAEEGSPMANRTVAEWFSSWLSFVCWMFGEDVCLIP